MLNMLKKLYKKVIKGNAEAVRIHKNLDNLKDNYRNDISQYIGMM